jgi:hypothetical protein
VHHSKICCRLAAMGQADVTHDAMVGNSHYRGMILLPSQIVGVRSEREQGDELAALHSITSSARASSVGGTSKPSVFAVFRLMTNSNFVGSWTGRSAGFAPLRIRAT